MDLSHRFGLKSVKADLDYSIPRVAQTLPYFLGSLTVTGLIILVSSGFYLLQFYDPDPQGSHQSVLYICYGFSGVAATGVLVSLYGGLES